MNAVYFSMSCGNYSMEEMPKNLKIIDLEKVFCKGRLFFTGKAATGMCANQLVLADGCARQYTTL